MDPNDAEDRRDVADSDQNGDGGREPESVADAAVEEVDQRIVDLLSWILDTETRAKIYVFLLANPGSTSEEVARGTGLYPSTVREALAELHDEERVVREKRANEGAGNNPYEYTAIQPSELVGSVVDQVQRELNTIVNLDRLLDRERDEGIDEDVEPVTITVDEADANAVDDPGASAIDPDETDANAVEIEERDPGDSEPEGVDATDGSDDSSDDEDEGA